MFQKCFRGVSEVYLIEGRAPLLMWQGIPDEHSSTRRASPRAPARAPPSPLRRLLSGRGCTDVRTKGAEARTPLKNQHRKKLAPPGIRTPARELSRPRASTLASAMSKASVLTSAHGEARISTGHRPRAARTMHRQVGAVSEWLRRADLEPEGRGFESRRVFYSALVGQL